MSTVTAKSVASDLASHKRLDTIRFGFIKENIAEIKTDNAEMKDTINQVHEYVVGQKAIDGVGAGRGASAGIDWKELLKYALIAIGTALAVIATMVNIISKLVIK